MSEGMTREKLRMLKRIMLLVAEGLELSAQLQFLDQQNLILSLENKALKQRLDCLVHEHLVKCLQHETLGQEVARLQTLYHRQQQQQQQQPPPTHRRSKSRDLDSQFANLSLKGNESSSGPDEKVYHRRR
ncbi:ABC transporter [Musa troglodytarum]|nr:ABC transporter [Musa troglodytarum]